MDELLKSVLAGEFLIGAVRLHSRWRFFAGTLGEWTLDYAAYDPDDTLAQYDTSFRGGLLVVDETNAEEFCAAMQPYELQAEDIRRCVKAYGATNVPLMTVVDFDTRTFIWGCNEPFDPKHEYVPTGWEGKEEDPYLYVPANVRALWYQVRLEAL